MKNRAKKDFSELLYKTYLLGWGDGSKRLKIKNLADIEEYFQRMSLGQRLKTNPGAYSFAERFRMEDEKEPTK